MAKGKGGTKAARRLAEAWGQGRIDYFDAFQRMADLAVEEADLLLELVGDFTGAAALEERLPDAHAIGAACDAVVDEVVQCADGDFVTPVARDEIVELAMAINEVTDEVERVAKHFHMYDISSAEPVRIGKGTAELPLDKVPGEGIDRLDAKGFGDFLTCFLALLRSQQQTTCSTDSGTTNKRYKEIQCLHCVVFLGLMYKC